jgi:hypothetical protein
MQVLALNLSSQAMFKLEALLASKLMQKLLAILFLALV